MMKHWARVHRSTATTTTHSQAAFNAAFFFLGDSGLGSSTLHRQQRILSSGFQVPQLGQSIGEFLSHEL
jgi:hypothetical protein